MSTASSTKAEERRRREHELFAEVATLPPDDPRRRAIRDELVTMHLPLVRHLAVKYRDRGEPLDDLVQVGTVALIKSVDSFDSTRGVEFSSYATPTILGEIKRHFRDHAWAIRVPRGLQELQARVVACTDELTARLHRSPTVREIAESLGSTQEDVLEALESRAAFSVDPLDHTDDDQSAVADRLGLEDAALAEVDEREALRPLLDALPDRERRIIQLRFFEHRTQSQIAAELGISQMHVSRLLARTLATLRDGLSA